MPGRIAGMVEERLALATGGLAMAATTEGRPRGGPLRPILRSLRGELRRLVRTPPVPVGGVDWGNLRRTSPISHVHGYDRGQPVDRHYVEKFLGEWSSDVHGHVLEVKDPNYTKKFGERVSRSDVLDIDETNERATIIADLNAATELPSDTFDCIIFTQTLQYIYHRDSALRDLRRSLRPGGVLLMTVPGITLACNREPWHWSFTAVAVRRLLGEQFDASDIEVRSYGNLLTATAFLYGLSAEDLQPNELAFDDPEYPLIIAARAVKRSS